MFGSAKTKPIAAAAAAVVLIAAAVFFLHAHNVAEEANALRDLHGNKVAPEQAERIRAADSQLPLASRLAAYGPQGERIAVSEVDPETYDGFVAVLNADDPVTMERLDRARSAGAVSSSDGRIAAFDSLDVFAEYFDESDLSSIEPNYKVYLADDPVFDPPVVETDQDRPSSFDGVSSQETIDPGAAAGAIGPLRESMLQDELLSAQLSAASTTISPNDPLSFDQTDLETIHVKDAWDAGASGEGVVVGVIDSGLVGTDPDNTFGYRTEDYEHEDLDYANHILPGWDFTKLLNGKAGPTPDAVGHGTFITGQIVATQGNGKGVTGIAPDAKVQPFKTHNEKGEGSVVNVYYALATILNNLNDPTQPHVDVLNISLINTNPAEYIERTYQALADAGVIIVAATGNQASSKPTYPASYDCVIGVAATKKSGVFDPSYSNYGAGSVYVVAPGTSIMGIDRVVMGSIIIGDTNRGPNVYSNSSGTSMACPEVAGLAALAKSIDKGIDQYEFMSRLRATSVDMGDPGYDQYYGWGLIDCGALIASMQVPDDVYASGTVDGIDWYITAADAPDPYQLVLSRAGGGDASEQRSWKEHADLIKSVYANPRLSGGAWLDGAFDGMVSVEAIRLGNMSVAADVSCQKLFDGLNSLKTIEIGSGWLAAVSFPDPPGANCVTAWAAASNKQQHAFGTAMPPGVPETYDAVYDHDYRSAGAITPPTLHEPGVSTQRCAVCGHETHIYSYADPATAGAAYWGEINGGVGWYITSDSYAAAPGRLMIYPLNGVAGTIKRQVAYPGDSAWPWDDHRSLVKSVRVAPGVNAGNSVAFMFRDLANCTSMELSDLDVSSIEYMNQAFYGCTALERLDLGSWNPASCENIQYAFMNCSNLRELIMPSSAFAILKTAKYAFNGCRNVTELDLSGIKFYENTAVDGFFGGCAFKKITLKGAWNIDLAIPLYFSGAYDEHGHLFSGKWEAEDGTTYSPSKLKGVSGTLVPYIAHKWGPPTIISTGTCGTVQQYTCTLCGKVKTENVEGSASHDIAHVPGQNATCEQVGFVEHWYCTKCATKFSDASGTRVIENAESVPALGHDRRTTPGTAATCTEEGRTGGEYCARCEKVFATPTKVPALGHDYEEKATSATCTEAGTLVRACKRCDDVRIEEGAPALGHDYETHETPATCTEAGMTAYACKRCGDSYTDRTSDPLGHDYETRETPATCTDSGQIAHICKRCDNSWTEEGAAPLGHAYEAHETTATCTEAGMTAYACKRCDASYVEQGAAPLGHDFSRLVSAQVDPTCTAEGREAVHGCVRCSEQSGGAVLPRTDHRAGAPMRENEVAPSCTEPGSYEERVACETCGGTLSSEHKTVPALGHDYEEKATSATCTEAGTLVRACKRCDDVRIEEGAPALGHDYETHETPATCTQSGRIDHACKRCDASYSEEGAAPLGHDYRTQETPATCTEAGAIVRTCKRCADMRTDQGQEALGHAWTGPLWQWADDLRGATAAFVCERTPDHKRILKAKVTVMDSDEKTEYTATVEDEGRSYTDTISIPKTVVDDDPTTSVPGDDRTDSGIDIGVPIGGNSIGLGSAIEGGNGIGADSGTGSGSVGSSGASGNTGSGNASRGSVGGSSRSGAVSNASSSASAGDAGSAAAADAPEQKASGDASLVNGELRSDGFRVTLRNAPGTTQAVEVAPVKEGAAYDALFQKAAEDPDGTFIGVFDVVLTIDGEERHDEFGSLDISFPVPSAFAGRSAMVYHAHAGDAERLSTHGPIAVVGAHVTLTSVSDLSPFAVKINKVASSGGLSNTGQRTSAPDPGTSGTARDARPTVFIEPRTLIVGTLVLVAMVALAGGLICFGVGRRRRR